jgi:hypothetical protein
MSTPFENVYNAFLLKLEQDSSFFDYFDSDPDANMQMAYQRAHGYLIEAAARMKRSTNAQIDFSSYDDMAAEFDADLTDEEIDILSNLMLEAYIAKDIPRLRAFQATFVPKDLQVFSPANERKTFLNMYNTIREQNKEMLEEYKSRDRLTGAFRQLIDYTEYSSEDDE